MNKIIHFMDFVSETLKKLGNEFRWQRYTDKHYHQSVLEHTLLMVILASICINYEKKKNPTTVLDGYKVLTYLAIHDLTESVTTDIPYMQKNSFDKKDFYARMDRKAIVEITKKYPLFFKRVIRNLFNQIDFTETEKEFIEAMERIEYVLYAANEYFVHHHREFLGVLQYQMPNLKNLSQRFACVGYIIKDIIPHMPKNIIADVL